MKNNTKLILSIILVFTIAVLISFIIDIERCKPKTNYAKISYNGTVTYVAIDKIKPLGFGICRIYDTDGSVYKVDIDSIEYIYTYENNK